MFHVVKAVFLLKFQMRQTRDTNRLDSQYCRERKKNHNWNVFMHALFDIRRTATNLILNTNYMISNEWRVA